MNEQAQKDVREWSADGDTPSRRLLVSCVSLAHYHDWQEAAA